MLSSLLKDYKARNANANRNLDEKWQLDLEKTTTGFLLIILVAATSIS
jgi:hypothetical protein